MFKGVTKADLYKVLNKIGEEANPTLKVIKLKYLLLQSKEYLKDKNFDTEFLATMRS